MEYTNVRTWVYMLSQKEACEKAARAMDKDSDPPANQRASTTSARASTASARGSVFSQHRQSGASQAPGATSL